MKLPHRVGLTLGTFVGITGGAIGAAGYASDGTASTLAVQDATGWTSWWRSDAAPASWNDDAPLARRVVWRAGMSGIEWGELQLQGASEAWRTRLVVVRLDPRAATLSLVPSFTGNTNWTIASVDSTTILALDAGQFRGRLPWGWVVSGGEEILAPEYAALAGAVVVDAEGGVRIVAPDSVAAQRDRSVVREAFQSYPMLLMDGVVPAPLRQLGSGVDLAHRDARLALGTSVDGQVIIALTRFDAFGPTLGRLPFGLTTPEMAAVMGGLGARNAILLDGGISSQLMLRHSNGTLRTWPGTRAVPLGLIARPHRAD